MPENRTLILADDLTGANDTAIQFFKQGLSSLVITHSTETNAEAFTHYHVISINSNSRGINADEAYQVVHETVKRLGDGYFVYKKVDSVLRGNPGRELAAVMNALGIPLALVAPSFPANRSVVEKGMLYSGGETNSGGIDAIQVFADGTGWKTENIPLEEIRRGVGAVTEFINSHNKGGKRIFVADALTDEDLGTISEASASLGKPHVLAGSAGLAGQLARRIGKEKPVSVKKPSGLSTALVIAGTRQGETAAQINALSREFPIPVIQFKVSLVAAGKTEQAIAEAYDAASRHMRQNSKLCVIAVESMFHNGVPAGETVQDYAEGDSTSFAISEALSVLTEKLMDSFSFPVILSTGGDISLGICRRLGISAIEPLAEICPGIPLGRITGGARDGHFIITKSGRFGNPDSLVEIFNYVRS